VDAELLAELLHDVGWAAVDAFRDVVDRDPLVDVSPDEVHAVEHVRGDAPRRFAGTDALAEVHEHGIAEVGDGFDAGELLAFLNVIFGELTGFLHVHAARYGTDHGGPGRQGYENISGIPQRCFRECQVPQRLERRVLHETPQLRGIAGLDLLIELQFGNIGIVIGSFLNGLQIVLREGGFLCVSCRTDPCLL
jgi:hypothetical protein